ncbi:MAG TPA: L-threonylcarbamoyladenylate synthase [Ktedonobacteraceae bacterium]|nr:L-threonylcarbamoyladenylate synthase [Ktedonobacteraceae bacterium]
MKQLETDVVTVDPIYPAEAAIKRAATLLRQGQLVVFPTETVYGLGADALQPAALERIFAAKGRPLSDPLIVHIAEFSALEELTTSIPEAAWCLTRTFWPGPLTLILPRGPRVPHLVTAGMETVAVRVPRHPVARALIRAAGVPVAAPSANRFMHVSPTTAQHAVADLGGRVPLILDGGPCEVGVESTILDLSTDIPTILRPGGVSLEAIRTVLPQVRLPNKQHIAVSEQSAQKAPGQLSTHYAPAIPLLLYDGSEEAMRSAMLHELRLRSERGEHVGVLIADRDLPAFVQENAGLVYTLGDAAQPAQIAAKLFASLRALEEAQVQVIICRNFAAHDLGLAIRDRLGRAAGGQIIVV